MQWDVFCKVIDNFGDIGVCWRLVRELARRGHHCRLWLDDWGSEACALRWMAPEVQRDGHGHPGVQVLAWPDTAAPLAPSITPGDVVIEAFGCNPPDAFVQRMQRPAPPVWINLEYFSAQDYVERSHGLPSPVFHGPGAGLRKWFFYPGMTERTGGLLRAPGLLQERQALQNSDASRAQALAAHGVQWQPGERVVSIFCYRHAPLCSWLDQLDRSHKAHEEHKAHEAANTADTQAPTTACHILLTPGPASDLAQAWQAPPDTSLRLHHLPAMPQEAFDRLLWACDLNIVRGEDSAVSALWTARPHIWHIYEQDDGVHGDKLTAFMNHWMADWPVPLRSQVQTLWRAFNQLGPPEDLATMQAAMHTLWASPLWQQWQRHSHLSSQQQMQNSDLLTRLLGFVTRTG